MKIVITQFISLDGVSQGPGSASEDPSGGFLRGGWFVPYLDNAFVRQASDTAPHQSAPGGDRPNRKRSHRAPAARSDRSPEAPINLNAADIAVVLWLRTSGGRRFLNCPF